MSISDSNSLVVLQEPHSYSVTLDRSQHTMSGINLGNAQLRACISALTGRSDAWSVDGPRRPLTCSGLGVAVPPPCNEFIELLTLLEGVVDCCTAPFSLILAFSLRREACDPAAPFGASLAVCVLSAFFLLLKKNAIVPCAAGNPVHYANPRRILLLFFDGGKPL